MSGAQDRVEQAMRVVARAPFLPPDQRRYAEVDAPLPIGHGQTNSQPYTVASMLALLDARAGDRALDLGSGSGWTTALLAHLVGEGGRVVGVERQAQLIEPSRAALAESGTGPHASILEATPGVLGAPDEGPFDRILVSAEAGSMPQQLLDQLADGGVMVIPVGPVMHRIERRGEELLDTEHGWFRFVPLVEE